MTEKKIDAISKELLGAKTFNSFSAQAITHQTSDRKILKKTEHDENMKKIEFCFNFQKKVPWIAFNGTFCNQKA